MLKPIRHYKISDQIFEQLRDMIYRGELQPGQRLMSERELAVKFSVGRPAVREAIFKLIDQGLVYSKRGVGTFVADEQSQIDKGPLLQVLNRERFSIVDLQEVRIALESKSAELAAKRATDEDVSLIKQSLIRIHNERFEGQVRMRTDLSFHMNIAYASKNTVQIHLMKGFYDVQLYAMDKAYTSILRSLGIDDLIDSQHEEIALAIANHDPERARRSMESQISTVLEICREHGF
ncbi:MAG: FadR family transcriptional regulator [Desulfobacteraceae bacterium]|nr:FadR family transcriptional regulator [Desulfobacteraceae bacterium]